MVLVGSDCCSSSILNIYFNRCRIELKNELILNYKKLQKTFL